MDNRFSCAKCPKSFGRRFDLLRHLRTVHKLQRFHCARCPKSYAHKCHLNDHVRRVHAKRTALQRSGSPKSVGFKGHVAQAQEDSRPLVCTMCKETFANKARLHEHAVLHKRTDGIECPVCHVKVKSKGAFTGHMRKRHPTKVPSGSNRKPNVKREPVGTLPEMRVEDEPAVADDIKQEDEDNTIEDRKASAKSVKARPPPVVIIKDETVLAEALPGEITHMPNGIEQQQKFKTSSGRVLIVKNQPACMTFDDFRKLFCIPPEMRKLIVFKKLHGDVSGSEQWIVPDDESTNLPLVDGCIIAETCTDF
ncbi:hypothetical protein AAVH_27563 [Aphelenchoides avenae]|nr:hypothetical protein AAVH_27563 [Aphelenchus avenae]